MDFLEVIEKRHSVRKFTDEAVPQALIDQILELTATAPSSKNCKSSEFLTVTDPDLLVKLSTMRNHGSGFMKNAKAAIVVMGDTSKTDIWVENCSISATFIQLAATALGLGSCWVHVRDRMRSTDDPSQGTAEDYVRSLLNLPASHKVLCIIALGYEAPQVA